MPCYVSKCRPSNVTFMIIMRLILSFTKYFWNMFLSYEQHKYSHYCGKWVKNKTTDFQINFIFK